MKDKIYFEPNLKYSKVSIQNKINSNNGHIDEDKLTEYKKELIQKGFINISIHDEKLVSETIKPGDRIAYRNKENKWRSGGFNIKIYKSNETNNYYIYYKPFGLNGTAVSIQLYDISELWYQPKELMKKKEKKAKIEIYNIPEIETDFPVCLKDKNGNEVVVYYASDKYKKDRFMKTEKFKNAQTIGWKFKE